MDLDDDRLGKTARDTVSGFSGVCTGVASYLHGLPRVQITARTTDNEPPKEAWFDQSQVVYGIRATPFSSPP